MNRLSHGLALTASVLLLTLGGLAGCGEDEPTAEEANAQVCDERDDLRATLGDLTELDPATVTRTDLEDAKDEIGSSLSDVEDAAREVADAEMTDLRSAYDDFAATVTGLDDDEPLQAQANDIVASATQVAEAFRALFEKAGCT